MRLELAEQGIWVVCVDEIPTFQVLERNPIRRAIPGSIEQQEFDYTRHGTVNMLVFLVVHSGLMELAFLEANDHEHYLAELELFHKQHKEVARCLLDPGWWAKPHRYWDARRTLPAVRDGGSHVIRPPMHHGWTKRKSSSMRSSTIT